MARIAGIDLPREKRIEIGLTYIYGIGRTSAQTVSYTHLTLPTNREVEFSVVAVTVKKKKRSVNQARM